MYIVSVQVQVRSTDKQGNDTNTDTVLEKKEEETHLSSDETFVLLISSIPKIPRRLTVAKAPRIANRHRTPKMDANHVYCISASSCQRVRATYARLDILSWDVDVHTP